MNLTQFYNQAVAFTTNAITTIEDSHVYIMNYQLDHLCYRVQDVKFYSLMKSFLTQNSQLLSATQINGREISTYKLDKSIIIPGNPFRQINIIELPSPKKKMYPTGFEHLEFVIPDISQFERIYFTHKFKRSNPGRINPTLSLQYANFAVKFHEQSLEDVIAKEKTLFSAGN